jgi:hypothetical protein
VDQRHYEDIMGNKGTGEALAGKLMHGSSDEAYLQAAAGRHDECWLA